MAYPYGASRSHSDTPHSVGLLWTSDLPDAETTHNAHCRQTFMPAAGFEPAIPASERPQTPLDRAVTGIGETKLYETVIRITLSVQGKHGQCAERW